MKLNAVIFKNVKLIWNDRSTDSYFSGNLLTGGASATGTPSISVVIDNSGGGIVNVTGTANGASSGLFTSANTVNAIRNSSTGTINIIGNCLGTHIRKSGQGSFIILSAVYNVAGGIVNITGNAIGGSTGLAVGNAGTGTVTVNGNAIGGTGWFAIEGVNSAGNTIIEKAIYSNLGQSPLNGYIKFKTTNPQIDVIREDNVTVTLRDPLNVTGLLPTTSDVRSGTTYNSGSSTGTLAMPAPNLVQLGVPVGATFGTANLTPGDFWNYLISNGFTTGSIGERLKESATTDIVGKLIQSF